MAISLDDTLSFTSTIASVAAARKKDNQSETFHKGIIPDVTKVMPSLISTVRRRECARDSRSNAMSNLCLPSTRREREFVTGPMKPARTLITKVTLKLVVPGLGTLVLI